MSVSDSAVFSICHYYFVSPFYVGYSALNYLHDYSEMHALVYTYDIQQCSLIKICLNQMFMKTVDAAKTKQM